MKVLLVRDVLDNQLLDASNENAGKVDGIVLELRQGEPPRVGYIEVGPITTARRLNRRLGNWVARFDAKLGEGRGVPIRIAMSRITLDEPSLRLDVVADKTPIMALERWLRRAIVCRIPWS
ncbi:MAG TPA: hypothetical protein VGP84_23770 [Gemmatimonadaceae bacterium]|jgi:hypothetical protein|nr:hypothetical protein [Gemmatimonadaceae bacterium]